MRNLFIFFIGFLSGTRVTVGAVKIDQGHQDVNDIESRPPGRLKQRSRTLLRSLYKDLDFDTAVAMVSSLSFSMSVDDWSWPSSSSSVSRGISGDESEFSTVSVTGSLETVCTMASIKKALVDAPDFMDRHLDAFLEEIGSDSNAKYICRLGLDLWEQDEMEPFSSALGRSDYFVNQLFRDGALRGFGTKLVQRMDEQSAYFHDSEEWLGPEGAAWSRGIAFPRYLNNFDVNNCKSNTLMCCHHPLDEENEAGEGGEEADENDEEQPDFTDNTDICYYHHHPWGATEDDLNEVLKVTLKDSEGPARCKGFTWNDPDGDLSIFMGNALFDIISREHLYDRGYRKRFGVAPTCQCLEAMPVVTRADCVQVAVPEITFIFRFSPRDGVTARVESLRIQHDDCGDLREHYSGDRAELINAHFIEEGTCRQTAASFLSANSHLGSVEDLTPLTFKSKPTTIVSGTGRRLHATNIEEYSDGVETIPHANTKDSLAENDMWYVEPTAECPAFSLDQFRRPPSLDSKKVDCYIIVNAGNDRRLYAESVYTSMKENVGAVPLSQHRVWDDQKWYFQKVSDGPKDDRYYIINAHSRRRLIASGGGNVGASSQSRRPSKDASLHWRFSNPPTSGILAANATVYPNKSKAQPRAFSGYKN